MKPQFGTSSISGTLVVTNAVQVRVVKVNRLRGSVQIETKVGNDPPKRRTLRRNAVGYYKLTLDIT